MFFDELFDKPEPPTPEQLKHELKAFGDSVREIKRDFPEIARAFEIHQQRWLIEQHEQIHLIH